MKPHAALVPLLALFLAPIAAAGSAAPVGSEPCPVGTCPVTDPAWTLFPDWYPGTPDFWESEWVPVREISICGHAIQFLFQVDQWGQPHHGALVFPRPTREMLARRLSLPRGSPELESEYEHFSGRWVALLEALAVMSGGTLREGARVFPGNEGGDSAVLVPHSRLELLWNGQQRKLRGYLDVHFRPLGVGSFLASEEGDASPAAPDG